jgi:hypothetical protein
MGNDITRDKCWRCGRDKLPTLAHILNGCQALLPKATERHNGLVGLVKKAVWEQMEDKITEGIYDNLQLPIEELSNESKRLRPDLSFVTTINGRRQMELIEFTCPYGYIKQPDEHGIRKNSMQLAFNKKHTKYAQLAEEIRAKAGIPTRVTVIVVSSLGAVYRESLKELGLLLGCTKQVLRKLGKKMSHIVINGSMQLWREYAKNMKHNYENEETNQRIAAELEIIEEERREEEIELELEQAGEAEIQEDGGIEAEDEAMETERRRQLRDIVDQADELADLESY